MPKFQALRAVLNLEPGHTVDELKKAYRKVARDFHPDLNPGEKAEKMMKKITVAYETLGDPEKMKEFAKKIGEQRRETQKTHANKKKQKKARAKKKNKK